MSTTTPEAREETRAEKIERFIRREALSIFLMNLISVLPTDEQEEGVFLDVEDEVLNMPSAGLWNELWPDWEKSLEPSQERAYADIRAELGTAQIFAALAAYGDTCREKADYFTALAEEHARDLQSRIQLRPETDDYRDPRVLDLARQLDEHLGEGGRAS
jgi:hypothetical protein